MQIPRMNAVGGDASPAPAREPERAAVPERELADGKKQQPGFAIRAAQHCLEAAGVLDTGSPSRGMSWSGIRDATDAPWRLTTEALRIVTLPFVRLYFALHGVPWGRRWYICGTPLIQRHRGSRIVLGDGLGMRSWRRSNPLLTQRCVLATRSSRAEIRVGNDCGISGAVLVAADRIEIGDRVALGANVIVVDTDFHPVNLDDRLEDCQRGAAKPVIIEQDAFIGMNSVILKGVTIGRGAVVGSNSVVWSNVPAGAVVGGNPARILRSAPNRAG
jgi:acetyltransferase-like isoleucine patch superfamily enzyme